MKYVEGKPVKENRKCNYTQSVILQLLWGIISCMPV